MVSCAKSRASCAKSRTSRVRHGVTLSPLMDQNDNNARGGRNRGKNDGSRSDSTGGRRFGSARNAVPNERAAIFIDGSNLYNGMRENPRSTRINLAELVNQLHRYRPGHRTYYYNAPLADDYDEELRDGQQRFFKSLRRIPYVTVRFGRLHRRAD